jgi:hypothetical protein
MIDESEGAMQKHDLVALRDFAVAWAYGWLCLPVGMCMMARLPSEAAFMHWVSLLHGEQRAVVWTDGVLARERMLS